MGALSKLKKAGGCAGGTTIYFAAKESARLVNINREKRKLWSSTKSIMQQYFPKLDLGKISFCINAELPANWFESPDRVEGMTFGNRIYFKHSDYQKSRPGLMFLMHELVHADQARRLGGETQFACEYGKGYLKGGSYRKNPMEVEAYDFVAKHGHSLPDGAKKTKLVSHTHMPPECTNSKHHSSCSGKGEFVKCVRQPMAGCMCIHRV